MFVTVVRVREMGMSVHQHVVIMHVTIIATAKHWILDAPAGWIALGLAVALETWRLHGFRLTSRE